MPTRNHVCLPGGGANWRAKVRYGVMMVDGLLGWSVAAMSLCRMIAIPWFFGSVAAVGVAVWRMR